MLGLRSLLPRVEPRNYSVVPWVSSVSRELPYKDRPFSFR